MTRVVIPYNPRPLQRLIHDNAKRFSVVVCHRRFGKTVMAINHLIKQALTCPLTNPRYAYIAPLRSQAKEIAWDYLVHYTREIPGVIYNKSELSVTFPNHAKIRLEGAADPDKLRGTYMDGCVIDEVAQMPQELWSEVIRPQLVDRAGWCLFIGTPKGHNLFYDMFEFAKQHDDWFHVLYKSSQTKIVPEYELEAARREMGEDAFEQEYECSFDVAIPGSFYARIITELEEQGKILSVPYDPEYPVHTAWDLGIDDATAIWFIQKIGYEYRIIDYREFTGAGLQEIAKNLKEIPYVYGVHLLPHDVEVTELGTGIKRSQTLMNLGITPIVVPRLDVADGINSVRQVLKKCVFDVKACERGLKCLKNYQRSYDSVKQVFSSKPLHDWSSHAADAFRYFAVGKDNLEDVSTVPLKLNRNWIT